MTNEPHQKQLTDDVYEAIRLLWQLKLSQAEIGAHLRVSRPQDGKLIRWARSKIRQAGITDQQIADILATIHGFTQKDRGRNRRAIQQAVQAMQHRARELNPRIGQVLDEFKGGGRNTVAAPPGRRFTKEERTLFKKRGLLSLARSLATSHLLDT